MGLKNAKQEYVHIIHIDTETCVIRYRWYRNKTIRDKPSDFDKFKEDTIRCLRLKELLRKPADSGKTIHQNLWTAGYLALLQEPPFNTKGGWMSMFEKSATAKMVVLTWED